jgi:hypothetical protein
LPIFRGLEPFEARVDALDSSIGGFSRGGWPPTRFHHQLDTGTPKASAMAADSRPALRLLRLLLFDV